MVPSLSVVVLLFLTCFTPFAHADKQSDYIRVAILQDAPSLRLKVNGFFEVIDLRNKKTIYRGKQINVTVLGFKDGIMLGNIKAKTSKLLIKTYDANMISVDGRLFRDNIQVIKKDNGRLIVINSVNPEDYIKGILYNEASHYWPIEALKAQAVVCRTYATYQKEQNKEKDFDLTNDIYSQVYGGRASERFRTNRAVDETKGEVILYQGKILPAYFHATCAGHTEDAAQLWDTNLPPLKGVECDFCQESPHFRWHCELALAEIKSQLTKAGFFPGEIKNIAINKKNSSGRITDLLIICDDPVRNNNDSGNSTIVSNGVKISAKDFRNIIGPNIIRSTNFSVEIDQETAVFEGLGWGHGVGMCQWGAYFMAKGGKEHKEILKFYYPGSYIEKEK